MYQDLLRQPKITEKATTLAGKSIYVFEVAKRATKNEIKKAIENIYKVKPVKVNIINSPSKKVFSMRTRKSGTKPGFKKAMVFLKEGDKIEFV